MKKPPIIVIIGLIAAALITLLILYMRPDTDVQTNQKTKADTSVAVNVSDTTDQDDKVLPNDTATTTGIKETAQSDGDVDFNAAVYGSSLTPGKDIVSENGTVTTDSSNGLNNPASDPNLKPINPEDDPANQIYSAPSPDEGTN